MSDDAAHHFEQQDPPTPTDPVGSRSFTLVITMQPTGQLEITGPINNPVLAFGMLQAAIAHLTERFTLIKIDQVAQKAAKGNGIGGLLKRMGNG